ncbi:CvpA family protein [uncultured Helicobacter sp.]|uniref:CvpA family protein n=2 Tax=uncultured Helicobacter sp. TaxID=175537 RepID=UPI00263A5F6C|nr:CvpA family protein [uncultured Helicobacter sp.]
MDTLGYIDIGILVLLILLSIKGFWQGIIRGLASLLGILLGIFFASRFYDNVGQWFAQTIYDLNAPELNALVGFLILMVCIWLAFLLIGETLFRILKITPLALLDGILGLVFAFIKAFLLISIIVFGITQIGWLNNLSQSIERDSSLLPIMKNLAVRIMNLEEVQEIKENLNNIHTQHSSKEDLEAKETEEKHTEDIKNIDEGESQATDGSIHSNDTTASEQ